MYPAAKEELKAQISNQPGYTDGVFVKLYSPKMSEFGNDIKTEMEYHTKLHHRVWMLDEIEVLSNDQVKKLQKYWDEHE